MKSSTWDQITAVFRDAIANTSRIDDFVTNVREEIETATSVTHTDHPGESWLKRSITSTSRALTFRADIGGHRITITITED